MLRSSCATTNTCNKLKVNYISELTVLFTFYSDTLDRIWQYIKKYTNYNDMKKSVKEYMRSMNDNYESAMDTYTTWMVYTNDINAYVYNCRIH
jgi:hypothetical protein